MMASVSVWGLAGHRESMSASQALQRIQLGLVDQIPQGGAAGAPYKATSQTSEQQAHGHTRWAGGQAQSGAELRAAGAGRHATSYPRNRAGSPAGLAGIVASADMD